MAFKRPNRNIEVFDISLMAVVTKAMGAFLVIMVMLLPYYYAARSQQNESANDLRKQVEELQRRLGEMQKNVGKYSQNPEELRQQLAAMQAELELARARLDDLQNKLAQANSVRDRLERDNAQLQAMRTQLESERNAALARAQAAEARAGELQARMGDSDALLKLAALPVSVSVVVRTKREIDCIISTARQARAGRPADEPDRDWLERAELKVRLFNSYAPVPDLTEQGRKIYREMEGRTSASATLVRSPPPSMPEAGAIMAQGIEAATQRYFRVAGQNGELTHFAAIPAGPEMKSFIGLDVPQGITECPVSVSLTVFGRNLVMPFTLPDVRVSTTKTQRVLLAVLDPKRMANFVARPEQADLEALKSMFKAEFELPPAPGVR